MSKSQEGVLDAIIFLGMMFGGYLWGSISDVIGRRSCLITSLTVNGVFGIASAFSPNYQLFLFFRFFSGVGVGGSFPVVFSYFSEFFSRKSRGPFVIILASFWILGSIFAALLAWIVIGQYTDSIHGQLGHMKIESWRIYIILCTFPCLSSAVALFFMPESPAFLFSKGKLKRTAKILSKIQQTNSYCGRSKEVTNRVVWEEILQELQEKCQYEEERERGRFQWLKELFRSTWAIFSPAHFRAMVVMLIIWFMFSFGYYGLLLWFPEYFKYIENCNYQRTHNCSFNSVSTDSCAPSDTPCNKTLSGESDNDVYLDSLFVALAGIPGTLLGIFTVNFIGAKSMLSVSLVVSGLSTLLIWVIPDQNKTERVVVVLSAVFGGVSIIGWNAVDVLSTSELFPVHLRSTAFGVQSVLGRIGAITGNISFGKLFSAGSTPYLPILLVASVLMFAGVSVIFLPNPRGDKNKVLNKFRCIISFFCRHCVGRYRRSINYNN